MDDQTRREEETDGIGLFLDERPAAAAREAGGLLSLAKIKGAFAMNNMQGRRVTCYMEDTEASRSFGESQHGMDVRRQAVLRLRSNCSRAWRARYFEKT